MHFKSVKCLILCCLLAVPVWLQAQIYPGDANNNGRVNNADVLYIGYAYGTVGPARINPSGEFTPQDAAFFWSQSFPGGPNYAYADANGNGLVEVSDLFAVNNNYGLETGSFFPEQYIIGLPGIHPALSLGIENPAGSLSVPQGTVLQIPVFFGSDQLPVEGINGLAFSLNYDPDIIAGAFIDFSGGWMSQDNQAFIYQRLLPGGKLEAAVTRFGEDPVSGEGIIGVLSIVVEDNLIDLLNGPDSLHTVIELEDVIGRDSLFHVMPLINGGINISIFNPDKFVGLPAGPGKEPALNVFPNPATGRIWVQSSALMLRADIFHSSGQLYAEWPVDRTKQVSIDVADLPPGVWLLRVETPLGWITRKLMKL